MKIFKKLLLTYFLLNCVILNIYAQQFYDDYFTDNALRIDFTLAGSSSETKAHIEQLRKLKTYSDSQKHLIDTKMYGDYRYTLYDKKTDSLLFSKGFNSLFREWQSTPEAEKMTRSYYHCVIMPFPLREVIFKLEQRTKDGKYHQLISYDIKPDDYFINQENPKNYKTKQILNNGLAARHLDIAFLPEGYTADEMGKFESDIKRLTDYLFSTPPFDKHTSDFNFYAVFVPSDESGTDIPGKHIYKNTAFNTSFYTFDSPRYLTTRDLKSVYDAAESVPFDQIYVLVNTDTYGGGGFYNYLNLTSVGHAKSPEVFVHEFCHGFAGLADEYYNPNDALENMYDLTIEPWEPNITTLINFKIKWQDMLKRGTPIPTPRTLEYENTLGVFEGGGYAAKGVYSPTQDCRMKTNEAKGYCPICTKIIEKTIAHYCE
ncbi:MAG: M64 family metallopeptidase [Mangrovibacterium sp.]